MHNTSDEMLAYFGRAVMDSTAVLESIIGQTRIASVWLHQDEDVSFYILSVYKLPAGVWIEDLPNNSSVTFVAENGARCLFSDDRLVEEIAFTTKGEVMKKLAELFDEVDEFV